MPEPATSDYEGGTSEVSYDLAISTHCRGMKRKLTVLFRDEDLYIRLKVEADRR